MRTIAALSGYLALATLALAVMYDQPWWLPLGAQLAVWTVWFWPDDRETR